MRLRRAVGDGLGHGVRPRPDDLGAQVPAVCAEGEGEEPGLAEEVFGLVPIRWRFGPS